MTPRDLSFAEHLPVVTPSNCLISVRTKRIPISLDFDLPLTCVQRHYNPKPAARTKSRRMTILFIFHSLLGTKFVPFRLTVSSLLLQVKNVSFYEILHVYKGCYRSIQRASVSMYLSTPRLVNGTWSVIFSHLIENLSSLWVKFAKSCVSEWASQSQKLNNLEKKNSPNELGVYL